MIRSRFPHFWVHQIPIKSRKKLSGYTRVMSPSKDMLNTATMYANINCDAGIDNTFHFCWWYKVPNCSRFSTYTDKLINNATDHSHFTNLLFNVALKIFHVYFLRKPSFNPDTSIYTVNKNHLTTLRLRSWESLSLQIWSELNTTK